MDKAQKYYTPKEWKVYKSVRQQYREKRLHCHSEYDLISLTFEMSPLAAAIEFEDCRLTLESAILKNSRKVNEARARLNVLSNSMHGDFVRKYYLKNHAIVAYEIKNLIAARQIEEKLRRELEKDIYNNSFPEENYVDKNVIEEETYEEPPKKDACFDSSDYDVYVEELLAGVEQEEQEVEPDEFAEEFVDEPTGDSESDDYEWPEETSDATADEEPSYGPEEDYIPSDKAESSEWDEDALPDIEVHTMKDIIRMFKIMRTK